MLSSKMSSLPVKGSVSTIGGTAHPTADLSDKKRLCTPGYTAVQDRENDRASRVES